MIVRLFPACEHVSPRELGQAERRQFLLSLPYPTNHPNALVETMTATAAVARRIPAGWYPDRNDRSRRQWFDGADWTDYFSAVPERALSLVPDLESDPEFSYTLDLVFESRVEAPAPVVVAATPVDEIVVEYETPAPLRHSLRRAITFRDRVPAVVLSSLFVGNVVLIGVVAHFI
jgi:hypothetical protein